MGFGFYWEYTGSKYLTRNYCSLHESSATVCRPLDQYKLLSIHLPMFWWYIYSDRVYLSYEAMISPTGQVVFKKITFMSSSYICMVKLLQSDFVLRFSTLFGDTVQSTVYIVIYITSVKD